MKTKSKVNGTCLSRDAILRSNDRPLTRVEVPEWGGHVFIRVMGGGEKDDFERRQYTRNGESLEANYQDFRARLAALTIVDEDGNRLFEEADVPALTAKSAAALDRVMTAALKANAFGPSDVEELRKNSSRAPTEGSGTA